MQQLQIVNTDLKETTVDKVCGELRHNLLLEYSGWGHFQNMQNLRGVISKKLEG